MESWTLPQEKYKKKRMKEDENAPKGGKMESTCFCYLRWDMLSRRPCKQELKGGISLSHLSYGTSYSQL